MNSRDKILSRIAEALKNKSDLRTADNCVDEKIKTALEEITPKNIDALWVQFKNELEKIAGEYCSFKTTSEAFDFICSTLTELKIQAVDIDDSSLINVIKDKLIEKEIAVVQASLLGAAERKKIISELNAAIVEPSYAIADTGSLVFTMDDAHTSYPHFLCDNTIAVIRKDKIAANQFELFEKLEIEKTKNMFFVTGPSRTADIEKVLVLGAHGPRRLIVITIEQ